MGLQFGRKYNEAPPATSGSGKWIKSLREGETKIRFLQEIKDWVVYYEHYNPEGTAFPCTGDRDSCPGCTSTNPRMKGASRKNAVNALVNGYVDVYKLPVKLTNRLVSRSERNGGTITDRDFLITRIGKDKDTEYDMESLSPRPLTENHQIIDIEALLQESFAENFPDFDPNAPGSQEPQVSAPAPMPRSYAEPTAAAVTEPPPFEASSTTGPTSGPTEPEAEVEVEVTEAQLRAMDKSALLDLCRTEQIEVPDELAEHGSPGMIVDFLLENV